MAIDVGKSVDVRIGQEFQAFHPEFTGEVPFMYSDGRTRRRLGMYPRVSLGRIIVFDVQPEVSFCRPAAECAEVAFPTGAHLEAVPLGSITHLLSSAGAPFLVHDVKPPKLLEETLANLAKKNAQFAVVVAALDNAKELEKERGSAFVNDALVALVGSLRGESPVGCMISQTESTQFSLLAPGWGKQGAMDAIASLLRGAAMKTAGAMFGAGCFATDADSGLAHSNALDLARYAASSAAREAGQSAEYFTPAVAARIIRTAREGGEIQRALADYERFKKLGINDAHVENQAAITAVADGASRVEYAVAAARRAVELAPNNKVFQSNAGLIVFCSGDRLGAWQYFTKGEGLDSKILSNVYWGPFALAAYEAVRAKAPGASTETATELLERAIGQVQFHLAGITDAELQRARDELRSRPQ